MADIAELGRRVKTKYPGQYDDLDDTDLGKRIKARYPGAYDDFTEGPAMPPGAAEFAKPPAIPKTEMKESPTPSGFLSNVAKGLTGIPAGVWSAATHPGAIIESFAPAASRGEIPSPTDNYQAPALASHPVAQIANYATSRYGSPSKLASTLYEDPVGAGMDIASVVAPIAGSARLATAAPRISRAARTAVAVLDPITEVAAPAGTGLAAELASRTAKLVNPSREGRMFSPKAIYERALEPSSTLPSGPRRLAELEKKTTTGFEQRFTPGSQGSLDRAVAEQAEWGRQKRALEATNPNAPVWLNDIQDYATRKATEDYAGRSGFWKMGENGPEIGPVQASIRDEIRNLEAEPSIRSGMRSYGPVPREVSLELSPTPPRLGEPIARSIEAPFTIPPSRQLGEPAIPLPPAGGPSQIGFDPRQVYEPTTTQPPGKEWVDIPERAAEVVGRPRRLTDDLIHTERVPQIEANIPPVPGRHLEGQAGRPEPIQPAPRNLVESTRDEQVRGVLADQGFTNEGFRAPNAPPPIPLEQSLAARGIAIERPIIPEIPQGSVKLSTAEFSPVRPQRDFKASARPTIPEPPTSQARGALAEMERTIADPSFATSPDRRAITQAESLRHQLATPGSEPYLPATSAERIKEGRGKDVDEQFGLPSKDVASSTTAAKYVHHSLKEALETIWPGIDKINANYGELAALIPDLAASVEKVKYGTKESAPASIAFAGGAAAAAGPKAAIPALAAGGMRSLLHSPQIKAKFAFWLDDQIKAARTGKAPIASGKGAARTAQVSRSAKQLQSSFDRLPKSEIIRIMAQLDDYLGID